MSFSFYWHDYETWGTDPRRDRPVQFAGQRTDAELNPIGKPLVIYSKPADDMLPQPEACLITGITPQQALANGLTEADFISRILQEMATPETCTLGYNNLRFDDEFTRYTLYRNFFDPYAREWQNGNSRWDIIDMVRAAHALRPEGIVWPRNAQGVASFRLEELTAANGISHEAAHDALSDVYATIAMARLIKERQPRLYDFLFKLRQKQQVAQLLNLRTRAMVLHVSSKYPSSSGCLSPIMPLSAHPTNGNGVLVYDLRHDPEAFINLDEDALHQRLFTASAELPDDMVRLPVKSIHLNKCPVVAPLNTLTPEAAERWSIDLAQAESFREKLLGSDAFVKRIEAIHKMTTFESVTDPDQTLYSGGFFSDADRRRMEQVRNTEPARLARFPTVFDDPRLPEMLFRYRARNWPETLSGEERSHWDEYRMNRLFEPDGGGSIQMDDYLGRLDLLEMDPNLTEAQHRLIPALLSWAEQIG